VAREIGHQHWGNVLLYDLFRFLDSIAQRREKHTSKDIRQQRSDDTDTRDPVELVGTASVLQEPPQRVRKLKSCRHRGVALELLWSVDRIVQEGRLLLAGMARPLKPAYLMPHQSWNIHCSPFRIEHRPRLLADISIEQRAERAEELQDNVQGVLAGERGGR
jgi:hypothetical protein